MEPNVFELIIDQNFQGIQAISLVDSPAIESDWILLAESEEEKYKIQLKIVDEEKRILLGAALIPNKTIVRKKDGEKYKIFFSKKTVRKASELFLKNGFQSKTTLEHEVVSNGNTVVESWIVEDNQMDKAVFHGLDVPVGTWMIGMKIDNDAVWDKVKAGTYKGFSIEGIFINNALSKQKVKKKKVEDILSELVEYLTVE